MADILESLYTHLSTDSTITDEVSTRIYPDFAPNGARRPYIVFYENSQDRFPYMGGDSGAIVDQLYIEAWADTRTEARDVREALRDVLNGFQRQSIGGLYIAFTTLVDVFPNIEQPEDGSSTPVFLEQSIYDIAYKESLTTA